MITRILPAALSAAVLMIGPLLAGPARAASGPDAPPPIPTLEERARFIAAHHSYAIEAGLGSTRLPGSETPAAIHDEYDVTHYDVALSLDIDAHILSGTVGVQATSASADLDQIGLDFKQPMVVDSVSAGGSPTTFSHVDELLTVDLDQAYQPGEAFTVICDFHGSPSFGPFRWSGHTGAPMILTYSEPFGAPGWWVCKDDPKDKATFTIHVTGPDTLFTVSNGLLDSVTVNEDGTSTCHWSTDYPMSPYLFSIATTNFTHWSEPYTSLDSTTTMTVDYYAFPEDSVAAVESWNRNVHMMEFFAGLFGEYPFLNEKYAIAEFQHPGAMEHQTATSMGAHWIDGGHANDNTVAHELSHSWVGDMITMREWTHAWCKEGFATYCEALYFENEYGEAYYHTYMNGLNVLAYASQQIYASPNPVAAVIYYKGGWVLHMLRHVLGDSAFFAGVREYVGNPAYRYANANTEELRDSFEAASGVDLDRFFDQWIYHPGYPTYNVGWASTPAGGGWDVLLQIDQVQNAAWPIYAMPIDVAVQTTAGETRFTVDDSLAHQSFVLHVDDTPTGLTIDPDDWLIKAVTTATSVASATPLPVFRVRSEPNPFSGETAIRFALPRAAQASLRVYDPRGRLVRELFRGEIGEGAQSFGWDGRGAEGAPAPAGVYFYRLRAGDETATGRLVLVH